MRRVICSAIVLVTMTVFAGAFAAQDGDHPSEATGWPEVRMEHKPACYWWWPGSATDKENITWNLETLQAAGMGGVHIIPIYGAKGCEEACIDYLTPEWMHMLDTVTAEAAKAGLGIDMTSGTGWPFGGPWVGPEHAAAQVFVETFEMTPQAKAPKAIRCGEQPEASLQALMAFSADGKILDLASRVDESGNLAWAPDAGAWQVFAVFQGWTKQQVKRAAPGDEGNVLDYFSREALDDYLAKFNEAFGAYSGRPPRCFYNDSYEVFRANWTSRLFDTFLARRGYDLRQYLPALCGKGEPGTIGRVRSDYCETIHDLLLEEFTRPWVAWAHEKGAQTRSQAHGSPGNLLDLYAAADIPETEGFGAEGAEILMTKFASSAAHVAGKPLVSSESCTWLGEHFQVSLAMAKPAIDQLFLGGVNHIIFHGMTFSPADVPWPGWLFYASTNFGPSNTFWRDIPALNAYIARCQSFLQGGQSDADVLLYFPIYDLWHTEDGEGVNPHWLKVHNTNDWLHKRLAPFHKTAQQMWERGYAFDYVSDAMLTGMDAAQMRLIIPTCKHMPLTTLEGLLESASQGAAIAFIGELPADVPGLNDAESRRQRLSNLTAALQGGKKDAAGLAEVKIGAGTILLADDSESALERMRVRREPLADVGIAFVRRSRDNGKDYFLVNRSEEAAARWFTLGSWAGSIIIFDPVSGRSGLAQTRMSESTGHLEVRLELLPSASCILRTFDEELEAEPWPYLAPSGDAVALGGSWNVAFIEGGPALPEPFTADAPQCWTGRTDAASDAFAGTASYSTTFDAPAFEAGEWMLDLGEVHESARVKLNGEEIGVLWCPPYQIPVGAHLKPGANTLEIEVTNLMANRIADMDRRGEDWRKFFFVNIDYKEFDASKWPLLPSGLAGPVTLTPYGPSELPESSAESSGP